MNSIKRSSLRFAILAGLGLWVSVVASVIEIQNARADFYLPRRDMEDGKWRISLQGTPRDDLCGLVSGVGLLQYLFAPMTVALGILHARRDAVAWRRSCAISCWLAGVVAMILAFYRGYFSSLGW